MDYTGEVVTLIIDRVRSATGTVLTDQNIDTITVIIYDADGVEVQAEDDATWDGSIAGWTFDWDSDGAEPGLFFAEVHVNSLSGPPGVEYLEFHLSRSPVPVGV